MRTKLRAPLESFLLRRSLHTENEAIHRIKNDTETLETSEKHLTLAKKYPIIIQPI